MTYFSKSVQLCSLPFDVIAASSEHQHGSRHNITNDSALWAMRWAPSEHDDSPTLLLRLRRPAIVHSVSFGKFSRPVGDNARDVVVYGGCHANALTPLLSVRLRNSAAVQTFSLTSSINDDNHHIHDGDDHNDDVVLNDAIRHVPFAIRFVRIVVRSSWSVKTNASIWHIALHGDDNPSLIARSRIAIERIVAARHLRRSLALLRRRDGASDAFDTLLANAARNNVRLEHPLVSLLFRAAIDAPTPLDVAAALEPLLARADVRRLFQARALSEPPLSAHWRRVPHSSPWPAARGGHQLCFDRATGRAYLFGGWTGTDDLGDLWCYEPATQRWTQITPVDGDAPSARSCHKIAFDPVHRRIYTLGRYVEPALEPPRPIAQRDNENNNSNSHGAAANNDEFLPWRRSAATATTMDDGEELFPRRMSRFLHYRRRAGLNNARAQWDALTADVVESDDNNSYVRAVNDDENNGDDNDDDQVPEMVDGFFDTQRSDDGVDIDTTVAAPAVAISRDNNDASGGGGLSADTTNNLSLAASLVSEFDEAAFSILLDMWRHGFLGSRRTGTEPGGSEASDGGTAAGATATGAAAPGVAAAHSWLENNARRARSLLTAVDYVGVLAMLINGLPDDLLERLERTFGGQLVLDDSSESGISLESTRVEEADFWYYSLDENRWHRLSRDTAVDGGPPLIYDQQMCSSDDGRFIYVFGGRCVDERARNVVQREPISAASLRRAVDEIVRGEATDAAAATTNNGASPRRAPSSSASSATPALTTTAAAASAAAADASASSSSSAAASSARPTTLMSVRARLAVRTRVRPTHESNSASHHTYCGLYVYDVDAATWTQLEVDEVDHVHKPAPPAATEGDACVDDTEIFHNVPLRSRIGHSMSLVDNQLHILGGQRESEYLADHIVYDLKRRCITRLHRDSSKLGGPGAGFTQRALFNRAHSEIHVLSGLVRPSHATRELVRNSVWVYSIPRDRWSLVVADGEQSTTSEQAHCSLDDMLGASASQQRDDGSDIDEDHDAAAGEHNASGAGAQKPSNARGAADRPAPRYAHQWVSDGTTHFLFGGNPGWARPRDTTRLDDLWELKLERVDGDALAARALFFSRQFHFEQLCDAVGRARAAGLDAKQLAKATDDALTYLQTTVVSSAEAAQSGDVQRLAARLLLASPTAAADADDADGADMRARVQMVEHICSLLPTTSIAPLE
jgi:hypothetical protein